MVDTLCLGLKDTFCNPNMHASAIQGMFTRAPMEFESIDYEDARSLILGAIEYARNLGFEPNPDWKDSQYVVESTRPFVPKYEFGRNGQPFYIQGPHDNVSQIMSKLRKFKSDFMIVKEPHHE